MKATYNGIKLYSGEGSDQLGEYELEKLPTGTDWIAYWYSEGSYDGRGYLLLHLLDGKYVIHDMGHCSCYGPTDQIELNRHYTKDDIDKLVGKDLNGNDIVAGEWDADALNGMWEAYKEATHD